MSGERHHRRVGAVRPSHLMFTSGVGALVDLPNFSVLVRGLDDWDYATVPEWERIDEPRLLDAVRAVTRVRGVRELRPAPWRPGQDRDPGGEASTVGVPVVPFPGWLRCTACDELAPVDSNVFGFVNDRPRRPHDARFVHTACRRRRPLAVPARFVLACTRGHLDDFPYAHFVHGGGTCTKVSHPRLAMTDRGGNLGPNVEIACRNCGERRNIREAQGDRAARVLPACRGRHPHLSWFDPDGCAERPKLLVVGASNQWFAQTLAVLHVPEPGGELADRVAQHWTALQNLTDASMLPFLRSVLSVFEQWRDEEIMAAVARHRDRLGNGPGGGGRPDDLRTPEWEAFSSPDPPEPGPDFALRRDGVPDALSRFYADVVQVERLREVRALIGFTRLDAPDPDDPDLVERAPLARAEPSWVPASEVRGEGIFLRLPEDLLSAWERRVAASPAMRAHRGAYAQFRSNRYSGRIAGPFEPMRLWPGARYCALHTLSHLLIRTIALECGYNAASLSERIYAGTDDDPRAGILVYTAVPDAEGTLGGLVSLAEPDSLLRLTRRALAGARHCSSDPLCAERLPHESDDSLHGAACHVCLFVSETTCERGNRFLDRRLVVPLDGDPDLALYPDLP